MISYVDVRCGSRGAAAEQGTVEMTEPGVVLDAVQAAMADLSVVLLAVKSGLGGECARAGRHLEMGEMDLLSARDAVEKARLEIDLGGSTVAGIRVTVPALVGSTVVHSAAPPSVAVAVGADVASGLSGRRRAGTRRRGLPGLGQGELFSVHDVTLHAV